MSSVPAQNASVPRFRVFVFTMFWLLPLALLLCNAVFGLHTFDHKSYVIGRHAVIVAMMCFAVAGLLRAFDLVGSTAGHPWYADAMLVSLVLFWGLFPPMWFFVEFLSFDKGAFALPVDIKGAAAADTAKQKAEFLASTKLYADLASKVWVAVGTALGAVIALVRRP